MTVSLTKITDTCSRCGADCASSASIEIDPLCTSCAFDFASRDSYPSAHLLPTNDPNRLTARAHETAIIDLYLD